ncbi:uncharacterized protein LOC106474312 [Limulus polyphemus]|uniref:Uncharacterized protein LOC106474312 n=1 Tax=Limulus polyphemus TaxID=6850 RepID=A0ABM1TR32_LIMPO|nr:uncharacterized protein LOC106474312 [Limulus polyphemus]
MILCKVEFSYSRTFLRTSREEANTMSSGMETLGVELRVMLQKARTWLRDNQLVLSWIEMCQEHPVLSLCVTVAASLCSIPLIAFATFILGVMLALLFAFLFIEGTLLTAGFVLFCGVLLVIGAAVVSIGASALATLTMCKKLHNMMFGIKNVFEDTPARSTPDSCQGSVEKDYEVVK